MDLHVSLEENIDHPYKQVITKLEEMKNTLKDKICDFEIRTERRLDDLEKQIHKLSNKVKVRNSDDEPNMFSLPNSYFRNLSNISLPGLNYITGEEPKVCKLVWLFIHIAALLISTSYIVDAYTDWQDSLVVQSQTYVKVEDIPYPAVTICEPVFLKEEYNRFEILKRCMIVDNETYWQCSEEELNLLRFSTDIYRIEFDLLLLNESDRYLMHKLYTPIFESDYFLPVDLNYSFTGEEYLKYIGNLAKKSKTKFKMCNKDSHEILEDHMFSVCHGSIAFERFMAIKEGTYRCQTLNSICHLLHQEVNNKNTSETVVDSPEMSLTCTPENILKKGCKDSLLFADTYLQIDIEDENEINFISKEDVKESEEVKLLLDAVDEFVDYYRVIIHSPTDQPSFTTTHHWSLPKHTSGDLPVLPTIVTAKDGLHLEQVAHRKCVFSNEKKLSLFKFYTYKNCILECQMNCSLAICGCIPYLHEILNSSSNICSNSKAAECTSRSKFFTWYEYKDARCECDCPMDCVSLTYDVQDQFTNNLDPTENSTQLIVSFHKPIYHSSVLYRLTPGSEFIAYSLGILGVFNGFSMIFIWEILYWMTLGLWSTIGKILHYSKKK